MNDNGRSRSPERDDGRDGNDAIPSVRHDDHEVKLFLGNLSYDVSAYIESEIILYA